MRRKTHEVKTGKLRIDGENHGSLSDHTMYRYGNPPAGIVGTILM